MLRALYFALVVMELVGQRLQGLPRLDVAERAHRGRRHAGAVVVERRDERIAGRRHAKAADDAGGRLAHRLAPVLQQLRRQHPRLELRIGEEDPARALQLVDTGLTDIALVHDADGAPLPMSRSLRHTQVHVDVGDVAVPAAHPLAARESLSSGDLRDQVWVTSPPGTVCHDWFRHLFAWTDIPEVRHSADDFSTQMALVAEGDVFALVPRLARPQPPPGVVLRPLSDPPSREVRAVWRSSSDASPGIRAVIAAVTPAQSAAP